MIKRSLKPYINTHIATSGSSWGGWLARDRERFYVVSYSMHYTGFLWRFTSIAEWCIAEPRNVFLSPMLTLRYNFIVSPQFNTQRRCRCFTYLFLLICFLMTNENSPRRQRRTDYISLAGLVLYHLATANVPAVSSTTLQHKHVPLCYRVMNGSWWWFIG